MALTPAYNFSSDHEIPSAPPPSPELSWADCSPTTRFEQVVAPLPANEVKADTSQQNVSRPFNIGLHHYSNDYAQPQEQTNHHVQNNNKPPLFTADKSIEFIHPGEQRRMDVPQLPYNWKPTDPLPHGFFIAQLWDERASAYIPHIYPQRTRKNVWEEAANAQKVDEAPEEQIPVIFREHIDLGPPALEYPPQVTRWQFEFNPLGNQRQAAIGCQIAYRFDPFANSNLYERNATGQHVNLAEYNAWLQRSLNLQNHWGQPAIWGVSMLPQTYTTNSTAHGQQQSNAQTWNAQYQNGANHLPSQLHDHHHRTNDQNMPPPSRGCNKKQAPKGQAADTSKHSSSSKSRSQNRTSSQLVGDPRKGESSKSAVPRRLKEITKEVHAQGTPELHRPRCDSI